MDIKHFFSVRKVEMSDHSELWELVTPDRERVASACRADPLNDLEMTLNLALTDAMEADPDVEIEA